MQQTTKSIPTMKGSLKRPLVDPLKSSLAVLPKASSFQLLRRQIETNQIKRVRIGFCESCRTINEYSALARAIHQNTSLMAVEIGWELPRTVLLTILEQVTRLPFLESLILASYTSIPKRLLQRLVSKSTLKRLELRNVTIGPSPWKERLIHAAPAGSKVVVEGPEQLHVSVLAGHFSDSIQSLHIVACEMEEEDVSRICSWTKTRTRPLDVLSFALSTSIAPKCLEVLVQNAVCRRLDLTGCDLIDSDSALIAQSLPQSKTIEELVVARNPLGGNIAGSTEHDCSSRQEEGFNDFIQVGLRHLKSLDLSFCSLSKCQVRRILELLSQDNDNRLESLTMLGIPKGCDEGGVLLKQILRNNSVLKSLRLHPTTDLYRTPSSSEETITSLEDSLSDNYTMERLQVGHTSLLMDLLLGLNRAGRRHLRRDPNSSPVDWAKVLAGASGDPDVMYWLLRNGAGHFFQN